MNRREFITLLGGAAATWTLDAEAQQASKVHRIGVVVGGVDLTDKLRQGLRELGWVEDENVVVVKRGWGAPRVSRVAVLWNPTHPGQKIARRRSALCFSQPRFGSPRISLGRSRPS
jgi:hypothetical protein